MQSNRWANLLSLCLTIVLFIVAIGSWIASVCGFECSNLLDGVGLRWLMEHALRDIDVFALVCVVLLITVVGAFQESGILADVVEGKNRRSMYVLCAIDVCFWLLLIYWAFAPMSPMLSATGSLSNSPFLHGLLPLIMAGYIGENVIYAGLTGRMKGLPHLFTFISAAFNRHSPWLFVTMLMALLYNVLNYIFSGI